MSTPRSFPTLAELVSAGSPGDWCTDPDTSAIPARATHVLRMRTKVGKNEPTAYIDTIFTSAFTEFYKYEVDQVCQSVFRHEQYVLREGARWPSRVAVEESPQGMPEPITHTKSPQAISLEQLREYHDEAVAVHQDYTVRQNKSFLKSLTRPRWGN